MARRRHGKSKEPPELDITAFLNLMVVLVPFLLVSAVFSRITILELNMPAGASGSDAKKPKISIEVVIREKGLEISNGRTVLARFPKIDNNVPVDSEDPEAVPEDEKVYDRVSLTNYLLKIKASYPDKTDSTILMEPDIEYRHLVAIMDTVRNAEVTQAAVGEAEPEIQKIVLFPDISIGDAP
ncbi:MAG: biopolymer transporter ExbD [Gammaproteobacteria bacterium]|nr:biopolymer transporter ExbD [Gammaproteobacteria bacterium]